MLVAIHEAPTFNMTILPGEVRCSHSYNHFIHFNYGKYIHI